MAGRGAKSPGAAAPETDALISGGNRASGGNTAVKSGPGQAGNQEQRQPPAATTRRPAPPAGLPVDQKYPYSNTETTLRNGTTVIAADPQGVNSHSQAFFGYSLAAKDYAALVAAPPGATIRIRHKILDDEYGDELAGKPAISMRIEHALYRSQRRTIYLNGQGRLEMHHDIWLMAEDAPTGTGRKIFLQAVNGAIKYGVDVITTEAAGDSSQASEGRSGWVGYYTWARFGYNAKLGRNIQKQLPPELQGAATLNQLFLRKGGPEWWKAHGHGCDMTFTVSLKSGSLKVLRQYLKEKSAEANATNSKEDKRGEKGR